MNITFGVYKCMEAAMHKCLIIGSCTLKPKRKPVGVIGRMYKLILWPLER